MKKVESRSGIMHACYTGKTMAGEHFIEDCGLAYIISGTMNVFDGKEEHRFKAGDMTVFRRNMLARFSKEPADGLPFESIAIIFDQPLLLSMEAQKGRNPAERNAASSPFLLFRPERMMEQYLRSMKFFVEEPVSDELAVLKKKEAILLLLQKYPASADLLFDFSTPGKLDLESFMKRNYRFNVSLQQMAYLTGRSLASFKRDFEKIFSTSPNRWIQRRRLEEAHYLIKEKKMKPKDVFMEVGFETLSHFSFAFKKAFGINPSVVAG